MMSMGSRMFHAIVLAGAALAEACGSSSRDEPKGFYGSVPIAGSRSGERLPANPVVIAPQDAAALEAETDALIDEDGLTPDANVASSDGDADGASSDGTAAEASSGHPWGNILVK